MSVKIKMLSVAFLGVFFLSGGLYAKDKPRVIVMDFRASEVSDTSVRTIRDIFLSRLLTSGVFDVLDRKNLNVTVDEAKLKSSGIADEKSGIELGKVLNAKYIITGSVSKTGKGVALVLSLINIETSLMIASSTEMLPDMDSVYEKMSGIVGRFIETALGINQWSFVLGTQGYSIEVGGNFTLMSGPFAERHGTFGGGFTVGFLYQTGDIASGFFTKWTFVQNALICNLGGLDIIFGDKVKGFGFLVGVGAGLDFDFGMVVSPAVGLFFRNFYVKYYPTMDITLNGDQSIPTVNWVHQFEAGYSIFLGTTGKEPTPID